MLPLFFSQIPGVTMRWETGNKDPACGMSVITAVTISRPVIFSPNTALGIVITDTIMKIHLHAGKPALPSNAANNPAF